MVSEQVKKKSIKPDTSLFLKKILSLNRSPWIKDFFKFSETMNFKIFRSFALMNKNVSTISNANLSFKNLFCELGVFLIEK